MQTVMTNAMAKRSQLQDDAVASLVGAKTWKALLSYQSAFSSERTRVESLRDKVCAQRHELKEQLAGLREACEFNAERWLAARAPQ